MLQNTIKQKIEKLLPTSVIAYDEPMALHTSFEIGGLADIFLQPTSYEELLQCLQLVWENELPYFLLGSGTNILVSDRGIRGVVIYLGKLASIKVTDCHLVAQTGATVEAITTTAADHSLSGLEFINGMPGSIGGAVWMNARCYGGSISDILIEATFINKNLEKMTIAPSSADFDYKISPFQKMDGCIWELKLQLKKGKRSNILQKMDKNYTDRLKKGHYHKPSAGSLFKNNHSFGAPTGQILDELGLRGKKIGGAAIAPFHGNIFINHDNATASDVLSLIKLAMEKTYKQHNFLLEPEIRFIGEWGEQELDFLKK